ncbi:unnamed protein product [Oikopleura dioica]|uniref:Uncharacterized protein n=1 Tax=Oikopleura dioica TaxID=34765 RepID=E4XHT5_OIKDI|nr:unnamed protein product [Oikopleura dioica]
MEIEFKIPSISRIQNEALGRRETPPVTPKRELKSEDDEDSEHEDNNHDEQSGDSDKESDFVEIMDGLFITFPLLKNPDSTSKEVTSDDIWKVFSRSINRVMSAGYLNEKEIIDKCRPGNEDYAKNQFIYVRQIYSVALDYFKLYLTNIAATEDGKPYFELHKRTIRIYKKSIIKNPLKEEFPVKTEPVSDTTNKPGCKFAEATTHKQRGKQINSLVRSIIKNTVMMLNYWHIDNYEHEYALLENTFVDFITYFFDFLDTVNQEMLFWWTNQLGKNFSYISADFRKGSHSLFRDALKSHWWFLEHKDGDIERLKGKLKVRPSEFTKRKEQRFKVSRSRAPKTRTRESTSSINNTYHTTQSQVRRDCFLQEQETLNEDVEPVTVFNFQEERICKVLLRILARTRFLWDKDQTIDKIYLVQSFGKLFDHSKSTAAYLLDMPESDLIYLGRLILCAEKIPQTKYAKDSVFGFFRLALACIQTYSETQKLNILAKTPGFEEKVREQTENIDIKEENKENIEDGVISWGLEDEKNTPLSAFHEFMSEKFAEINPFFNSTIEIFFDVIKLARERYSPELPQPIFIILRHFERELFEQQKASTDDIYTWFRIITEVITSKFKNASALVNIAINGLLTGVATRSLDCRTYLVFSNACFTFVRENRLMKSALEKFVNSLLKLSQKIVPDPAKATILSNALVNLNIPNDLIDFHFTACGSLLNFLLLNPDENHEGSIHSMKESILLVFTQLKGYQAIGKSQNIGEVFRAAEIALGERELPDDFTQLISSCREQLRKKSPLFAVAIQKLCNYLLHRKDLVTLNIAKLKFIRALIQDTFHNPATRQLALLLVEVISGDFCGSNEITQLELPYKFEDHITNFFVVPCKALPRSPTHKEVETISSLFENIFDVLETPHIRHRVRWTTSDLISLEGLLEKIYVFMTSRDSSEEHVRLSKTIMKLIFVPFAEEKPLTDPRTWQLLKYFSWKDVDEHLRSLNPSFMHNFISLDCSMWKEVVSIACHVDQPQSDRSYAKQVLLKLLPIASKSAYEGILEDCVPSYFGNIKPDPVVGLRQLNAEVGCEKIISKFPSLVKTAESEILDIVSKTLVDYSRKDMMLKDSWKIEFGRNPQLVINKRNYWIPPMGSYTGIYLSTMCNILGYSRPKDLFMPQAAFLFGVEEFPGFAHPYVMLIGSGALFEMPLDQFYWEIGDMFSTMEKPKDKSKEKEYRQRSSRDSLKKLGPEWARKTSHNSVGPQLIAKLLLIYNDGKERPEVFHPIAKLFRLVSMPWYAERRPIEPRRRVRQLLDDVDDVVQLIKFAYAHLCAQSDLRYKQIIKLLEFFRESIARYDREEDFEKTLDDVLKNLNLTFALGRTSVFLNETFGDSYCRMVLRRDRENRIKEQARFAELFTDLRENLVKPEQATMADEQMVMTNSVEPSQTQGGVISRKYPPFSLKEVSRSVLRVLHQTLSTQQPGMSCFYCAAEVFEKNPCEENFHTIIFPASQYIFLMQQCVPTIKAHFFYESIRVFKILFQYKFSQPFGLKLWSSVHNDIFVSEELRREVTPYCVELLGYFCRLWNMSDAEDKARMLSYFRKYVSTIIELLNRKELAIKDRDAGMKTSADIVFILKCLPKQVWGQIKYRWHFMDLELVKYPSFMDSSSYVNKMCVLMRHIDYYCCQLPGMLKIYVSYIFYFYAFFQHFKSYKATADTTRSSRTCSYTAAINPQEVQYFPVETRVTLLRNTFRTHFTENSMRNSKPHAF